MKVHVNARYQITLPKKIRDALAIERGGEIEFAIGPGGHLIVRTAEREYPWNRFEDLVGFAGPGPTSDEVMAMTRGDD